MSLRMMSAVLGVVALVLSMDVRGEGLAAAGFEFLTDGWTVDGQSLVGQSPEYDSLPGSAREEFLDDAWTYHTVHPALLWRYAVAGTVTATDYRFACKLTIEKPAPLKGFRPGITFFNYQWGREAPATDAAILVRFHGAPCLVNGKAVCRASAAAKAEVEKPADQAYMVRISSACQHVELWKTGGGVLRVKPFAFKPGQSYQVVVTASGPWMIVAIDGQELIRYGDGVEPILGGRIGLAVRESRVRFSDFALTPAAAIADPIPPHQADFRQREWVGQKWIFDGDEPIGWFGWMAERGLELREVKLRPGLMPLVCPHGGMERYDYTPGGDLKITEEGKTFGFRLALARKDAYTVESQWQISYDPAIGYVLDKRAKVTALKDQVVDRTAIEDLYFYQLAGPATDKLPACRTQPNWCIAETADQIVAFPNAHHIFNNGCADPAATVMKSGGCFVATIDGWGVACQFMPDNDKRFYSEQCHWGLDAHMVPVGMTTPLRTGESYQGHVRIFAWDKAKVAAALKQSVLPKPVSPTPTLIAHVEPVNKCDRISPALTGESLRFWIGNYQIDRTTGRGDSVCMKLDAGAITNRTATGLAGDDRPSVWQGPSYWTGPYAAGKYRVGMYVKADDFKGKVSLLAESFNHPKGTKLPALRAELPIDGKCDWTRVSYETALPHQLYNWVLRIDAEGQGKVYIDDFELIPLNP